MADAQASRRGFLVGLCAAGLAPRTGWSDAGNPAFLAAGWISETDYRLFGLRADGSIAFELPLPGRGHAAAAHPHRPEAVAFARRPGTFALVIDCRTGARLAELTAPQGRHFYGHGAFCADGRVLFTTENAYDLGEGRLGLWDTTRGYARLGEIPSGGIGPHEVLRLPGTDALVVANGGIDTHPDSGRTPLNLPVMQSRLSYLSPTGGVMDQVALPPQWHLNSIRHIAARADGTVAAALQWQGDRAGAPPLLMLHKRRTSPRFLRFPVDQHRDLAGYAGSVAFDGSGQQVALTSPRGGVLQLFDVASGEPIAQHALPDVCGLAPTESGLALTTGTGRIGALSSPGALTHTAHHPVIWDNHLVPIPRIPA